MLFLFRKICRSLTNASGASSKASSDGSYLLYAIGEIFLVVVGILIAVSIDDWNEARKNRSLETKYLKNIRLDLQKDLAALDTLIEIRGLKVHSAQLIVEQIRGEATVEITALSNSIVQMIMENKFVPNNTTFSELSNSGNLSLISNDSIKVLLLELENMYKYNEEGIAHETFDYREYISKPTLRYVKIDLLNELYFGRSTAKELGIKMVDFEGLLRDTSYRNGVAIIGSMSPAFIDVYQSIQSKSAELIMLIDKEANNN